MKQLVTIAFAIISISCLAQTNWEKVDIGEKINVSFPSKPTFIKEDNFLKRYALISDDFDAKLFIEIIDLSAYMCKDEASIEKEMNNEESWVKIKNDILESMGAFAFLQKEENTTIHSHRALKLIVNRINKIGKVNIITILSFVIGTNKYQFVVISNEGDADEKLKQQFFDSIEFN